MVFQKLFSTYRDKFFIHSHSSDTRKQTESEVNVVRILFSFAFFIPSLCFISANLSFVRLSTLATYLKSTYLHCYCFLFFSFNIFSFLSAYVVPTYLSVLLCQSIFHLFCLCSFSKKCQNIFHLIIFFSNVIVKVRITAYFCDNIENVCLNLFADDRLEGSDNKTLE
jgi:hypothetical protein